MVVPDGTYLARGTHWYGVNITVQPMKTTKVNVNMQLLRQDIKTGVTLIIAPLL